MTLMKPAQAMELRRLSWCTTDASAGQWINAADAGLCNDGG